MARSTSFPTSSSRTSTGSANDWFQRPELQAQFKDLYGYDLGVPVNWSAYEDIAEFFSVHVQEIDGVRVYGPHGLRQACPGSRPGA